MKTTKRTALNARIEKLIGNKELRRNSLVYAWVCGIRKGHVLRPVFSQGRSWKHSSLIDKSDELELILTKLKISFTSGNDAPRGGKTGYFIKIDTKIID